MAEGKRNGTRKVSMKERGGWGVIVKVKPTKGEAGGKAKCMCMCVRWAAAGILAALLCVAQWVVILLASLCDSFWPRRASCDESAKFPGSAQGQQINHRKSNAIWHTTSPTDFNEHTHTHILSLIQSICHPCVWLDEHIKDWNEEIKSRGGMRKLLDNPVILFQWFGLQQVMHNCCSYNIKKIIHFREAFVQTRKRRKEKETCRPVVPITS